MRSIFTLALIVSALSLSACGTEISNACIFVEEESEVKLANGAAFTPECQGGGEFDEERYFEENGSSARPLTDAEKEQLKKFR